MGTKQVPYSREGCFTGESPWNVEKTRVLVISTHALEKQTYTRENQNYTASKRKRGL